jgi:hypothetical protein
MSDAPETKPGDWIKIGSVDCLVIEVHSPDRASDKVDVICNPARPAVYGANWVGDKWEFAHPMRGDYAEHHPAAAPYVDWLKAGRD